MLTSSNLLLIIFEQTLSNNIVCYCMFCSRSSSEKPHIIREYCDWSRQETKMNGKSLLPF